MIYGNADFLGIPWETIIKTYKARLGNRHFSQVKGYVNNFIHYLENEKRTFSNDDQSNFVDSIARRFFSHLRYRLEEFLQEKKSVSNASLTEAKIKKIFTDFVDDELNRTRNTSKLNALPKDFAKSVKKNYQDIIVSNRQEIFGNFPMLESTKNCLVELVAELLTSKRLEKFGFSGIVIAGFGEKEHFPTLFDLHFNGIVAGRLLYRIKKRLFIDMDVPAHFDPLDQEEVVSILPAHVVPFAQEEMVLTFMQGVHPYLRRFVKSNLSQKSQAEWEELRRDYVQSFYGAIEFLPKSELGEVAEFLVNLTKVKRHVSDQPETVGGPIDVAVITKTDGFVWIRRKHYFKADLNPQYFERKFWGSPKNKSSIRVLNA